jgi:hypothetical protein
MNEDYIKSIAQKVFDENQTSDQFAVAQIGFHKHNGQDAPRIPFLYLGDVPNSYYQQKGRSIIVDTSEQLLKFSSAVITLTSTTGFIYLPTCAGTPTGVPENGNGAVVYDTTNNKLYCYNGGWKSSTFT